MKIGIIGSRGIVGSACSYGFRKLGHEILEHDIVIEGSRLENLLQAALVFICVPTPAKDNGACDTSIVEGCVNQLLELGYKGHICVKSTVTPGTIQRMLDDAPNVWRSISFVPEFLRERHAYHDFTEGHNILIVGTHSDVAYELVVKAHGHYPKNIVRMTPTEAELSKYFHNVFNALRVVYANGFNSICTKMGADYTKIKNAVVQQPTMVDSYLDCNPSFGGFGGMCLPKDTKALAKLAEDLRLDCKIFETIVRDNYLYKRTVFPGMRM